MSRNLRKKNVTVWASLKARAPKTSPYGHLAKLVPQKRHHIGISQSSCPKKFGEIITDQKQIANLLTYHYSKFGDFFGEKRKGLPTPNFTLASTFVKFQP